MSESKQNASVGLVKTRTATIDLPPEGLVLESGDRLPELTIAYETYGKLSSSKDNVILICHALSGNAHVAGHHDPAMTTPGWWDEMVGPGKGIDTDIYYVVCANVLGGCNGTTGPSSIDPRTDKPYGSTFPKVCVTDIVNAHRLLLQSLSIDRLAAVAGGSFGGMQALEWTILYPEMVERCICIASTSSLSTQALAFDIVGRHAIQRDPDWRNGDYYAHAKRPHLGLSQARKIGHITYLSPEIMNERFGRERRDNDTVFQVESYLEHQGKKFVERFDANSYLSITYAMDEYDLQDRFGSLGKALEPIRAKILVVALSSDWLFPPEQSKELATGLLAAGKQVSYCELRAPYGHDAFLVDIDHLAELIAAFLPWVGERKAELRKRRLEIKETRQELEGIAAMIEPGTRVLDLGCGQGHLLSVLSEACGVSGVGVDIDLDHVINVIDRGHDVFQGDIDGGLASVPDQSYDYAILSETLQVVRKPRLVLREMLRVAKEGIVTFPNFGTWARRVELLTRGRMPRGGVLPFEWYETPNIHLFTLRDFVELCREDNITIVETVCLPGPGLSKLLLSLGLRNLGAEQVLAKVTRRG